MIGKLITAAGVVALLVISTVASAQSPELRPVSVYVGGISEGDMSAVRYVSRRCTALFLLISANAGERGQSALADGYSEAAVFFFGLANQAEVAMGSSEDAARSATAKGIQSVSRVLMDRMNLNMATTGSHYADDPLLASDVRTCAELSASASGG